MNRTLSNLCLGLATAGVIIGLTLLMAFAISFSWNNIVESTAVPAVRVLPVWVVIVLWVAWKCFWKGF